MAQFYSFYIVLYLRLYETVHCIFLDCALALSRQVETQWESGSRKQQIPKGWFFWKRCELVLLFVHELRHPLSVSSLFEPQSTDVET